MINNVDNQFRIFTDNVTNVLFYILYTFIYLLHDLILFIYITHSYKKRKIYMYYQAVT